MCKTCKNNAGANAPVDGGNKFQSLIESPEVHPYAPEERDAKTVNVNEEQFVTKILSAIQSAAESHVVSRIRSLNNKIKHDV